MFFNTGPASHCENGNIPKKGDKFFPYTKSSYTLSKSISDGYLMHITKIENIDKENGIVYYYVEKDHMTGSSNNINGKYLYPINGTREPSRYSNNSPWTFLKSFECDLVKELPPEDTPDEDTPPPPPPPPEPEIDYSYEIPEPIIPISQNIIEIPERDFEVHGEIITNTDTPQNFDDDKPNNFSNFNSFKDAYNNLNNINTDTYLDRLKIEIEKNESISTPDDLIGVTSEQYLEWEDSVKITNDDNKVVDYDFENIIDFKKEFGDINNEDIISKGLFLKANLIYNILLDINKLLKCIVTNLECCLPEYLDETTITSTFDWLLNPDFGLINSLKEFGINMIDTYRIKTKEKMNENPDASNDIDMDGLVSYDGYFTVGKYIFDGTYLDIIIHPLKDFRDQLQSCSNCTDELSEPLSEIESQLINNISVYNFADFEPYYDCSKAVFEKMPKIEDFFTMEDKIEYPESILNNNLLYDIINKYLELDEEDKIEYSELKNNIVQKITNNIYEIDDPFWVSELNKINEIKDKNIIIEKRNEDNYRVANLQLVEQTNYFNSTLHDLIKECEDKNKTKLEELNKPNVEIIDIQDFEAIVVDPDNSKYQPPLQPLLEPPAGPTPPGEFSDPEPNIDDYTTWEELPPVDNSLPESPVEFPDILNNDNIFNPCNFYDSSGIDKLDENPLDDPEHRNVPDVNDVSFKFAHSTSKMMKESSQKAQENKDSINNFLSNGIIPLDKTDLTKENDWANLENLPIKSQDLSKPTFPKLQPFGFFSVNFCFSFGEWDASYVSNTMCHSDFHLSIGSGEVTGYDLDTIKVCDNLIFYGVMGTPTERKAICDAHTPSNGYWGDAGGYNSDGTEIHERWFETSEEIVDKFNAWLEQEGTNKVSEFLNEIKEVKDKFDQKLQQQKIDYPNAYVEDAINEDGLYKVIDPQYYIDLKIWENNRDNQATLQAIYEKELVLHENALKEIEYTNNLITDQNKVKEEIGKAVYEVDVKRLDEQTKYILEELKKRNDSIDLEKGTDIHFKNELRNENITEMLAKKILKQTDNQNDCLSNIISHTISDSVIPAIVTTSTLLDFDNKLKDQIAYKYYLNDYIDELNTHNRFNFLNFDKLTSGIVHNPNYMFYPMIDNPELNPNIVFEELNKLNIDIDAIVKSQWKYQIQEKVTNIIENNEKVLKLYNQYVVFHRDSNIDYLSKKQDIISTYFDILNNNQEDSYNFNNLYKLIKTDMSYSDILLAYNYLINNNISTDILDNKIEELGYSLEGNNINDLIKRGIYLKILDNNCLSTITTYNNYNIGCRILIPLFKYLINLILQTRLETKNQVEDAFSKANVTHNEQLDLASLFDAKNYTNLLKLETELNLLKNYELEDNLVETINENVIVPEYCSTDIFIDNDIEDIISDGNDDNDDNSNDDNDIKIDCLYPIDYKYSLVLKEDTSSLLNNWNFSFNFKTNSTGIVEYNLGNDNIIKVSKIDIKLNDKIILTYTADDEINMVSINKNLDFLGIKLFQKEEIISGGIVQLKVPVFPEKINTLQEFCGDIEKIALTRIQDEEAIFKDKFEAKPDNDETIYYNFQKLVDNNNKNINIEDDDDDDTNKFISKVYSYNDNLPANIQGFGKNTINNYRLINTLSGGLTDFFCKNNIKDRNFTISFWFKRHTKIYDTHRNRHMLISDEVNRNYVYYNNSSNQLIFEYKDTKKVYNYDIKDVYHNIIFSYDHSTNKLTLKLFDYKSKIFAIEDIIYIDSFNFNLMSIFCEYDFDNKKYINNFYGELTQFKLYFKSINLVDLDNTLNTILI